MLRFSHILIVGTFFIALGAVQRHYKIVELGGLNDWSYFVSVFVGLLIIFGSALFYHRRRARHFNMLVASESLVGYGIASLVGGVVVALAKALFEITEGNLDHTRIAPIALPFLEGLAIAALAPLLAIILRNIESESGDPTVIAGAEDVAGHMIGTAHALETLSKAVEKYAKIFASHTDELTAATARAGTAASAFATALSEAAAAVGRFQYVLQEAQLPVRGMGAAANEANRAIVELGKQADAINAIAREVAGLLGLLTEGVRHVSESAAAQKELALQVKNFTKSTGDAITAIAELKDASKTTNIELKGMGVSVRETDTEISELGKNTRHMKAAADEATTLLIQLTKLIDSVNRFISAHRVAA